ncbi:hypothetical protein BC943DRAFT_227358 [Umbelopsis sp. AD052]|nr:hypothetical protein BC943DRAFT_227358 [Umbelopsis sp. AD052]
MTSRRVFFLYTQILFLLKGPFATLPSNLTGVQLVFYKLASFALSKEYLRIIESTHSSSAL